MSEIVYLRRPLDSVVEVERSSGVKSYPVDTVAIEVRRLSRKERTIKRREFLELHPPQRHLQVLTSSA
jgi:hypothetical protein